MIIAFSGKARSGKTTAADIICKNDPSFAKVSFASPLKQMAMDQFDLTPEDILDKDKVLNLGVDNKMTVRELLIKLGQLYRAIDPDFWVNQMWKKAEEHISHGRNVVIDDLRFKNEAWFLEEKGAFLVRIERPVKMIDDISETDLDYFNFPALVPNEKSIIEFQQEVVGLMRSLKQDSSAT